MERFAHVIFDLDSTLTDTLAALAITRSRLLSQLAIVTGLAEEVLASEVAALLRDDFHNPDLVGRMARIQAWVQRGGRTAEAVIDRESEAYYRHIAHASTLVTGADETLTTLHEHGIRCVVWTNKRSPFARRHLRDLGLDDGRIHALYCRGGPPTGASDVSLRKVRVVELTEDARKPNVATTKRVLAENAFVPERTIFVGNNIRNDGGATIGMRVAFVMAAWDVPTRVTRDAIFRLTEDERLSYGDGGRHHEDHAWYVGRVHIHATLRHDCRELLSLIGITSVGASQEHDVARRGP